MFRLPPIRLWRNCSLALFGVGGVRRSDGDGADPGQAGYPL